MGLALVAFVFLFRMPNAFLDRELNVDESQFLAQGMKFAEDPVPWRAVDGTGGGPVDSYVVTLFLLAGFKPSYLLVHLLANAIVSFHVALAYATILRFTHLARAVLAVIPIAIMYSFTSNAEFLHYSSELLPVLFLSAGFYQVVVWWTDGAKSQTPARLARLFVAGFALGIAPWCKLQAAPITATLGVLVLGSLAANGAPARGARERLMCGAAFLGGALIPSAAILTVVVRGGVMHDFWNSYVLQNVVYAGGWSIEVALKNLRRGCWNAEVYPLVLCNLIAIVYLLTLGHQRIRAAGRRIDPWQLVAVLAYTGSAFFALCRPALGWLHHAVFVVQPMTCLFGVLIAPMPGFAMSRPGGARSHRTATGVGCGLIVALVYAVLGLRYVVYADFALRDRKWDRSDPSVRIVEEVKGLAKDHPVRSLAIWGWTPAIYVRTGIPPATRDAIGHYVITPGPFVSYFRNRFVRDLRDKMPDVFIDTVSSSQFIWSWTENDGYESDAELKGFIDRNYVLTRQVVLARGSKPVRIFTRR
ncbi:hypothetical protein [uncultured Paludibaculum sp.]|uniref:hypothetical protein n=1 Tax=uncultured Paludibaculum sp. TaxID=1765020 RepID=UPI002AABD062|nr:hypothetical protein [uncultured Paludibaculum sp.]